MNPTDEQAREAFVRYGDERHLVGRALLTLEQERDALKATLQRREKDVFAAYGDLHPGWEWLDPDHGFQSIYADALRLADALHERDEARDQLSVMREDARRCAARYVAAERETEALRGLVRDLLAITRHPMECAGACPTFVGQRGDCPVCRGRAALASLPEHDDQCESELDDATKQHTPCRCAERAACYVGNKSHSAHDLLAPGAKCSHCSFVAPSSSTPSETENQK